MNKKKLKKYTKKQYSLLIPPQDHGPYVAHLNTWPQRSFKTRDTTKLSTGGPLAFSSTKCLPGLLG